MFFPVKVECGGRNWSFNPNGVLIKNKNDRANDVYTGAYWYSYSMAVPYRYHYLLLVLDLVYVVLVRYSCAGTGTVLY